MKSEKFDEMIIEENIIKVNGDIDSRFYTRGKELGKGGFARVYELTNNESNKVFAGKVIEKSSLTKGRTRQKLMSEIKIHRSVHHKGIVNFEHFFEDSDNIYILLEICNNGNLNEVLKRRRKMAELEVQCYLMQLYEVLKYLRGLKVLHRDIKLSNLFLNENMELKLGDFGLACKIEFEGERKRTMCGTPNYIAPEILDGRIGHSYEVDTWSFGIIAYTLLVGKPPFQGEDARATYKRIKANNYGFPESLIISSEAKDLIANILISDPNGRLSLDQIREHPFFLRNIIPRTLPLSTLCVPPSGSYLKQFESKGENRRIEEFITLSPRTETSLTIRQNLSPKANVSSPRFMQSSNRLYICISNFTLDHEESWVEKWVDHSEKYGLGFKLSNSTVGVHFNDNTKIVLDSLGKIIYLEGKLNEEEKQFNIDNFPPELYKKIRILQNFNSQLKTDKPVNELVYIKKWVSNSIAIIFRLSNRNVHAIFHDKTEILIQGAKKSLVFLENNTQSTYLAKLVPESGNQELIKRMRFVKEILVGMVNPNQ